MAEYKPPIGGVPATVLKLLLNIAGAFTKRITHVPSRKIVDGFVTSFGELITALADTNPNDADQIRAVVNRLLTEGDFYEGSRQTITANINKIANDDVKTALLIATGVTYRVADVLTDEFDDNGAQLEEMLKVFLSGQDGVLFITSLLKTVVDDATANLIALLLIEALKGVISEDRAAALDDLKQRLQTEIANA